MNLNHPLLGGGRGGALLLAAALLEGPGWGAGVDFERYQVILNRKPFGAEAPPPEAAATGTAAVPDAESFVKNLKMTAITKNDITGSLCVGLSDAVKKKNYFLNIGDEEDGIALLEADYEHERALLRKEGDSRWINMNAVTGGGVAAAPVNTPPPLPLPSMRVSMRGSPGPIGLTEEQYRRTLSLRPMPSPASASLGRGDPSGVGREKLSNEQIEERLRKYNMDLIRAKGENGLPLPIPLSPEEDAQLVKEGVLTP